MSNGTTSHFKGSIGRTWEDSKPWWPQLTRAAADAPDIMYIILDDVGFGNLSCHGGPSTDLYSVAIHDPQGRSRPFLDGIISIEDGLLKTGSGYSVSEIPIRGYNLSKACLLLQRMQMLKSDWNNSNTDVVYITSSSL
jgi:hypothetical protein